jgi:hypothetical protein
MKNQFLLSAEPLLFNMALGSLLRPIGMATNLNPEKNIVTLSTGILREHKNKSSK